MKPLEIQTLLALLAGLFLSINYAKSQDKIVPLDFQSQVIQKRGSIKPSLAQENHDTTNALRYNELAKTYERVVLEGSKIIIGCPHSTMATADRLSVELPLQPTVKVSPEIEKQFASDDHYRSHRNHPQRLHPHHRHQQRPQLVSHSDSRQQVKWFRNRKPLKNYSPQHSYNSPSFGAPLVTPSVSVGIISHPQQTAATSTSQEFFPNKEKSRASLLTSTVVDASDDELAARYDPTMGEVDVRSKVNRPAGLWFINRFDELVIDGVTQYFSGVYTCRSPDMRESTVILDVLVERLNEGTRKFGRDRAHKIEAPASVEPYNRLIPSSSHDRNEVSVEFVRDRSQNEPSESGKSFELQTNDRPNHFKGSNLLDQSSRQKQEAQELMADSVIVDGNNLKELNSSEILQGAALGHETGSNEESPLSNDGEPSSLPDAGKNVIVSRKEDKFGKIQEKAAPKNSLKLTSSPSSRYIKRYIHVVKNEAIRTSDLEFIPGFLYNKLQLYCPVREQSNFVIYFLTHAICPRHLKQLGNINRRAECQRLARCLIRQIVSASQRLNSNWTSSIFDLIWFKNGKRIEFDAHGKGMSVDVNVKLIDPLDMTGLSFGRGSRSSKTIASQQISSYISDVYPWTRGRVLEIEGPRTESTGRYMCAYELSIAKLKRALNELLVISNWLNPFDDNYASCYEDLFNAREELNQADQQASSLTTSSLDNSEMAHGTNMDSFGSSYSQPSRDSLTERIHLLESILRGEVARDRALDWLEQLLSERKSPLSIIQAFSLSIAERSANFSDLWSTITEADNAYARRKRADFERLRQDFSSHLNRRQGPPSGARASGPASKEPRLQLQVVEALGSDGIGPSADGGAIYDYTSTGAAKAQASDDVYDGVVASRGGTGSETGNERHSLDNGGEKQTQMFAYESNHRQMLQSGGVILESGKLGRGPAGGQPLRAHSVGGETLHADLTSQQTDTPDMLLNNANELLNKNIEGGVRQVEAFMQDPRFNYANELDSGLASVDGRSGFEMASEDGCESGGASQSSETAQVKAGNPRRCKVKRQLWRNKRATMDLERKDYPNPAESGRARGPHSGITNSANQGRLILIQAHSEVRVAEEADRSSQYAGNKTQDLIIDDKFSSGGEGSLPEATHMSATGADLWTSSTLGRQRLDLSDAGRRQGSESSGGLARDRRSIDEELGGARENWGDRQDSSLQGDKLQHSGPVRHRRSNSQLNSFFTQSSVPAGPTSKSYYQQSSSLEAAAAAVATSPPVEVAGAGSNGRPRETSAGSDQMESKIDKPNHGLRGDTSPAASLSGPKSSPSQQGRPDATVGQQSSLLPYGDYESGASIDDGLMWQASQYLYMHMKAVAASSIFGVEVAVEWSNELTNGTNIDFQSDQHHRQPASEAPKDAILRDYLIDVPFATIDVISGQDLRLECTAQAMGRLPEVKWYKRIGALPSKLKGLISLVRRIGDDLYWPLTELDLLSFADSGSPSKSFICSESLAIFDNLVNQTFTVVNNLQLSHYNDLLEPDPVKSISLPSFISHNTYACIVDADVRHNYATLGVNFRRGPNKMPLGVGKRLDARSTLASKSHASPQPLAVDPNQRDFARFDLFRSDQLMFPIRSWTYIHNGSAEGDNQLEPGYPVWSPPVLVLAIGFVLGTSSALIYLTIRTYRNFTRFSLDETSEEAGEPLEDGSSRPAPPLPLKSVPASSCSATVDERGIRTGCSCSTEAVTEPMNQLYGSAYEPYDMHPGVFDAFRAERGLLGEMQAPIASSYSDYPGLQLNDVRSAPYTCYNYQHTSYSKEFAQAIPDEYCTSNNQLPSLLDCSRTSAHTGNQAASIELIENPLNLALD